MMFRRRVLTPVRKRFEVPWHEDNKQEATVRLMNEFTGEILEGGASNIVCSFAQMLCQAPEGEVNLKVEVLGGKFHD